MNTGSWKCKLCTFLHYHNAHQCVMCGHLRITKQQMSDFVRGIPIDTGNASTQKTVPKQGNAQSNDSQTKKTPTTTMATQSSANPYVKSNQKNYPAKPIVVANESNRRPMPQTTQQHRFNPYAKRIVSSSEGAANSTTHKSMPINFQKSASAEKVGSSQMRDMESHQQQSTSSDYWKIGAPSNDATSRPQGPFQKTLAGRKGAAPLQPKPRKQAPIHQQKGSLSRQSFAGRVPYTPGPVPIAEDKADEWVFPIDEKYPKRNYQFEISQTAVMHNTLVTLPTGLGKTLIAAVVMYNFYRWFPTGKVVFMAPTLPLVNQQVKACHQIMGIPEVDTAVLTGKTDPQRRQHVWDEKRTFFCTPQTMTLDIDNGRLDPKRVVLVVLDEAHRARGAYAYNKIVEQLTDAGARFRVVGLSATPGSQLKSIQEVVTSLRISRVECRSDDDPDVRQYIHDRQEEVVVVKHDSATRKIEQMINNIVEPHFKRLRESNALRHNGVATLTAYTIMKARQEYVQKTGSHGLTSIFETVRQFADVRATLHTQGIGMARQKLTQIRDKSPGSKVVQSKEFQELLRAMFASTCDPNIKDATIEQRLMNNPKLAKMQEILVEHFNWVQLEGKTSSRAIVFSQFRDSVFEIERVLNASRPVIRPRYFIGQGSGNSKTKGEGSKGKGMSQKEQNEVIQQFKQNLFNVLVCTSIGEEGLDIGEVDVIINYDCIVSPVRSLQRVGRTGRKRDGRVICLLSEGPEEKKHRESKSKQRTVMRALKNASFDLDFTCAPMLPDDPHVVERTMATSMPFRMSQVEGHGDAPGRRKDTKPNSSTLESKAWRLTAEQEARRAASFGDSHETRSFGNQTVLGAVRKRLCSARNVVNASSYHQQSASRLGIMSLVLRSFESNFEQQRKVKVSRRRSAHHQVDAWFPIVASESGFEELAFGNASSRKITLGTRTSQNSPTLKRFFEAKHKIRQASSFSAKASRGQNPTKDNGMSYPVPKVAKPSKVALPQKNCGNKLLQSVESTNSRKRSLSPREEKVSVLGKDKDCSISEIGTLVGEIGTLVEETRPKKTSSPAELKNPSVQMVNDSAQSPRVQVEDEFRLPTPASSSDEESDNGVSPQKRSIEKARIKKDSLLIPNENGFQLPTQDSSSSSEEEDDDNEEEENIDNEGLERDRMTTTPQVDESDDSQSQKSEIVQRKPSLRTKRRRVIEDSQEMPSLKEDSDVSRSLKTPRNGLSAAHLSLNDTPETQKPKDTAKRIASPLELEDSCSSNTDENIDDIVCAVCGSGASPDEDPIYLCDGPGGGVECSLAVHATCYSVTIDEGDWRCDPCAFKFSGGSGPITCSACGSREGALKRVSSTTWAHPRCRADPVRDSKKRGALKGRTAPKQRLKHRRYANFLEEEADISSEDDMDGDDGEDSEVDQIAREEDELHSGFINDSSQLGFSPDALDAADPGNDDIHRRVDQERAKLSQFRTPQLNRRMRRSRLSSGRSGSQSGLGNMNFIRSVIEHHRNGGDAEEIEAMYQQEMGSQDHSDTDEPELPAREDPQRTVLAYEEDDSDEE